MKNSSRMLVVIVILTLLSLFILAFLRYSPPREQLSTETCRIARITVLVDNNADPSNAFLETAWGISIIVEADNTTILFDTGSSPLVLERNSHILGVNLSSVDVIVVSHEHWDHVGGLEKIAEVASGRRVYVPAHMSREVKDWIKGLGLEVVEVGETTMIARGVWIIGEMRGPPYEQALAVNVEGLGLIVVVGCSHPGVENIVEKACSEIGVKPYAVIGGFHLAGKPFEELNSTVKKLLELGVEKIYPIHCSGENIRRLLEEEYCDHYGDGHVGLIECFSKMK